MAKLLEKVIGASFSWANRYFEKVSGGPDRPAYHDIEKTYPALSVLTKNYSVIRRELEQILPMKDKLPQYHEIDASQHAISVSDHPEQRWNVFFLTAMGMKHQKNCDMCPETMKLIEQIPNVFQSFFSILDKGKSIPVHREFYMGYLRYHLGLIVPRHNPPQLHVNGQPYTWKEGEAVLFDDLHLHEVTNQSDDIRVILIVDVLRPMPSFANFLNHFLSNAFIKNGYFKYLLNNLAAFDKQGVS